MKAQPHRIGAVAATNSSEQPNRDGMGPGRTQRLRHLEDENLRLKELIADLVLELDALKSTIRKRDDRRSSLSKFELGRVP
jgi:hypothetical protein